MGCTRRIQQRFHAAKEAANHYWLQLTVIAKAVLQSQVIQDYSYGLNRTKESYQIVRSALFDTSKESKTEESNSILRPALVTNLAYYVAPVGIGMGFNYVVSQIPYVGGSYAETILSSGVSLGGVYFLLRRLLDNSLYTACLVRANEDEKIRNAAREAFAELAINLVRVLARAFAKKNSFEEFHESFYQRIRNTLGKYFEEPDLYRHRDLERNFAKDLYELLVIELIKPTSNISPNGFAQPFARVLTKMILARLGPHSVESCEQIDKDLKPILEAVNLKTVSQDVINHLNFFSTKIKTLSRPNHCSHDANDACGNVLVSPLKYVIDLLLILLIGRFAPLGSFLEVGLMAQFYGRGLRELKLSHRCTLDRIYDLSNDKAISLGVGTPFALATYGIGNRFLRDAVLSMMLLVWTIAEIKDKKPLVSRDPSVDFFRASRYVTDLAVWGLNGVVPKIAKKLSDPKRQRLVENVKAALSSKPLHWVIAATLGEPAKVPTIKFKKGTQLVNGFHFKDLEFTPQPDAVNVLFKQIDSVNLFLKFFGNDIDKSVSVIRKARVFKPWLASPFLVLFLPGTVATLVSLALHLLKAKGVDDVLGQLSVAIASAKRIPLQDDEQIVEAIAVPEVKEHVLVPEVKNVDGVSAKNVVFVNEVDLQELEDAVNQPIDVNLPKEKIPEASAAAASESDGEDDWEYIGDRDRNKYNAFGLTTLRDNVRMELGRCAGTLFSRGQQKSKSAVVDFQKKLQ